MGAGAADSDVAEFRFHLTAIATQATDEPRPAKGTYTLSGQQLQQGAALGKGVYIIDGRKVVVK